MALESTEPPDVLRQRVTSPGGTTEAALAVLQRGGLAGLFEEALTAARDRSVTLSDELGGA
jgi:pyrroline-5-carboxylate reductase